VNFTKPGRRVLVTADTHFLDPEACRRYGRPFESTTVMDDTLVERINATVGERDVLLHVGDFASPPEWTPEARRATEALRERIACRRIVLVRGNQDPRKKWFERLFHEVHDCLSFRSVLADGTRVRTVVDHYPTRMWHGWVSGAVHLHGHAHAALDEIGRSTDVGVDCWNYEPVPLVDLVATLARRPFTPPDAFPRLQEMRRGSDLNGAGP
jgi:calcineurin-like phosphoesterase family protein